MSLRTVTTIAELRAAVREHRSAGRSVGFVPTMGALHAGHAALVRAARAGADVVVVSIFVNPLQFGDASDLERYPRTLDADEALLADLGADLVFAPNGGEVYPGGPIATRVVAGDLGDRYEGASRPGHFDGVLTVVSKLVNIVSPDRIYFGEKDAQQVFLVRRMLADLNEPVEVVEVSTVREPDGLARSSRNVFLTGPDRTNATALSRALFAVRDAVQVGSPLDAALDAAKTTLHSAPGIDLDYLVALDPTDFGPATPGHVGPVRLVVAAKVGSVRLIDTVLVPTPPGRTDAS